MNVGSIGNSKPGEQSQDFDLNLAPIIDCFIVLITFMMASASYLAIGILDAAIDVPGQGAASTAPPAISLDIELLPQHEIKIRISGRAKMEKKLSALAGDWDLKALRAEIDDVKKKWPDTKSLVLSGHDDTQYREVVRIMESARASIPNILLGGF